ncbi:MAG: hypothetical protein H0U74_23525 [Bradymonadaceae bacterium]|nr:hypothetical protein [Lujinxingiaceae bacterium]
MFNHLKFAVPLALVLAATIGCSSESESSLCEGPEILPHLSPVSLGEFYPLGNNPANLTSNTRTPFEWVLLLQSTCSNDVKITKTCLVGDPTKNGSDTEQFIIEGPVPATATLGAEAAMRVTYERRDPNGGSDSDQVALVIQSNATNYPTLIVPICARVVEEGATKAALPCASPIVVAAGDKRADLCN